MQQKKITSQNLFEISLLKELGERIGYSLNIQNIVDIITGSIHQFMEYTTVSYMIIQKDQILFNTHIEDSIPKSYLDSLEKKMFDSISTLLDKDISNLHIEKLVSGLAINNDNARQISSYFNVPIIIQSNVVGIITVTHFKVNQFREDETNLLYKITQTAANAVSRLKTVIETERTKMKTMVHSMHDGILMLDNDYRVLITNPSLNKLIGLPSDDSSDIFDIINALGKNYDLKDSIEKSMQIQDTVTSAGVRINDHFLAISTSPLWSRVEESKKIVGTITVFHNMTKEKKLEKMRTDLTAMMVHELRTPVTGIKQTTELLKDGTIDQTSKEYSEYLDTISNSSDQILSLVNDILDISKMESGEFKLEYQQSDIRTLIKKCLVKFDAMAASRKLNLTSIIDPKLPATVLLDPKYACEAIDNYLSNAIKFTRSGSVTLQAFVHRAGQNISDEVAKAGIKWFVRPQKEITELPDSLIIAVTDTGVGVPYDEYSMLFSKFSQLSTASESDQEGTGLGLSVVKSIAIAHGGTVGVGSINKKGSTFYISFPLNPKQTEK